MQVTNGPLPLPERPSIAVLPFAQTAGDFEAQVVADGVTDHLTYALSCTNGLFVSSRNSTFAFKGRRADPREVRRLLGVGHVLEGSLDDAVGGERVTMQARLRETETGAVLWSERFEGDLDDVVGLRAAILARTVAAIAPAIPFDAATVERTRISPEVGIYARFLAAYANDPGGSEDGVRAMLGSLASIARLLPGEPLPPALMSQCHATLVAQGWSRDVAADAAEGTRLARAALATGAEDSVVLMMAGHSLGFLAQDLDAALELLGRSLRINPNSAAGYERSGWVHCYVGDAETAAAHFRAAKRQSPLDETTYRFDSGLGLALCMLGAFEEALAPLRRSILDVPRWTVSHRVLAACLAHLGREDEARAAARDHQALDPSYGIDAALRIYRPSPGRAFLVKGMRKAGIPG